MTWSPSASEVTELAVADLDGGGAPDLVALLGNSQVAVGIGAGDGTFTTLALYSFAGGNPRLAVGDVSGDGAVDVVVGVASSTFGLYTFLNQGSGALTGPTLVADPPATGSLTDVALRDVDGDGKADALVSFGAGSVRVQLGEAAGLSSTITATLPVGLSPTQLLATDLDQDGKVDLVTSNFTSFDVSILRGRGGAAFDPEVRFSGHGQPALSLLRTGDVDGDGKPDLVVGHTGATCSVLLAR